MPETNLWNRRFIFLLMTQAGFGFAHSAFLMLPKFLAVELDAGPKQIGSVVAVSAISIVIFLIPAGSMVDQFGRRHFLTAGALLMAISSACYVFVEEIGLLLYVLRTIQSLAFAYAFAAGAALCVDAAPLDRLGQAIGLSGLSYVIMSAFAPAAVESLATSHGWNACFLMAAGSAMFCSLLSLFIHEDEIHADATTHVPLLAILRRTEIQLATVVVGMVGIACGCAFSFYQPFALSLGMAELRGFFIAYAFAAAFCRLGLGPFVDRIGLRRVSLASLSLYIVVIFCMAWLNEFGLIGLGLGMGLAHGLFYPAYTGILLEGCPAAERGRRMAIIQAGFNGGVGSAGIVLGWVASRWGYPIIFQIAAGCLLLAGILIVRDSRSTAANGPIFQEVAEIRSN